MTIPIKVTAQLLNTHSDTPHLIQYSFLNSAALRFIKNHVQTNNNYTLSDLKYVQKKSKYRTNI